MVTLLPPQGPNLEVDIALRAIGAVVVQVSPAATHDQVRPLLKGVDARLIVAEDQEHLGRLAGLVFPNARLLPLQGGRGWMELRRLGVDRLRMDPDAVSRVDRLVHPPSTLLRVLGPGGEGAVLGRTSDVTDADLGVPAGPGDIVLVQGDLADPFVQRVRDLHLRDGFALAWIGPQQDLVAAMATVRPTVLALGSGAARRLPDLIETSELGPAWAKSRSRVLQAVVETRSGGARMRRGVRHRAQGVSALAPWFGGRLRGLVATELSDLSRFVAEALDVQTALSVPPPLEAAALPEPHAVTQGDSTDLPRRSRRSRDPAFALVVDASPATQGDPDPAEEAADSAFVLPSMPLFGGESFLDKVLMQQAAKKKRS